MIQQQTEPSHVDAIYTAAMASVTYAQDAERENVVYATLYAKGEYSVFPLCTECTVPLDESINLAIHRNSIGDTEIVQNGSWVCDLFQLKSLSVDDFMIVISPSRQQAERFGKTWARELTQN